MASPMPEMHEFYDAFSPRLEEAIDYCDKFPLDDLPEDALNLLHLIYSMIMVSMAVEVFGTARTRRLRRRGHRPRQRAGAVTERTTMSLLTINKLTDSVGAEVLGVDSDRLATDDSLGAAVLDALEDNGVLVFPRLGLEPEAQVAFCRRLGEIDHSSDGHHPVAGIYPITLDKSKNASAAYLRATFDWHIDGCTPIDDDIPAEGHRAVGHAGRRARRRDRVRELVCRLRRAERRREGALRRRCGSCTRWRRRSAGSPRSRRRRCWRGGGRGRTHEHPLVWTHRSGRKSLVLGASADYVVGMDLDEGRALLAELLDRATAAGQGVQPRAGRSATPSSGTTAASCTGRHRTTPTHRGRCCAPRCWATSRSSIADALSDAQPLVDADGPLWKSNTHR